MKEIRDQPIRLDHTHSKFPVWLFIYMTPAHLVFSRVGTILCDPYRAVAADRRVDHICETLLRSSHLVNQLPLQPLTSRQCWSPLCFLCSCSILANVPILKENLLTWAANKLLFSFIQLGCVQPSLPPRVTVNQFTLLMATFQGPVWDLWGIQWQRSIRNIC